MTSAHVNSADYSYAYDAIGNRTSATEAGTSTAYTSNRLNQYTAEGSFRPEFDADGNQTLIKTSTGIWNVTYNAKNRPVRFEKADSSIVVECTYDTMGRRATKKVTTNGTLTEHRRFLYRGYLQIACCDLTRAYTPALWFITWDPTQPTATRPLAIQKNGTWYTYGWDLTKNICETYRTDGRIDLAYTYTPYGECTPAHTYDQPIRWSSEYHDVELGLVYYNYRHYNPAMGRWMGRDPLDESNHLNLLLYAGNRPAHLLDRLGLEWNSEKGREALRLAMRLRGTEEEPPSNHPCCAQIKTAANGDCITFAAGVIECAYKMNGDDDTASKIAKLTGKHFTGEHLSPILESVGWKMVVYVRDIRRAVAEFPLQSDLPDGFLFVSGEGIQGTFNMAINRGKLYGMTVHGAVYNLNPFTIRNRTDNNAYNMPEEKFGFAVMSNSYHTGILQGKYVYNYHGYWNPIQKSSISEWTSMYNAAQVGWFMLAPDSLSHLATYHNMLLQIKGNYPPKVVKSSDNNPEIID